MSTSSLVDGLLAALWAFSHTMVGAYDLQELLHRLTGQAIELTRSQGAGVMLEGPEGLRFASASDEQTAKLEVIQDRIGEGVCRDAFVANEVRMVEDLQSTQRWGEYRDRALALGFRAVLGVPMNAAGQTIGVLNVYRRHAGVWDGGDVETAEVLASMASAYVLHANQARVQHELQQLHAARRTTALTLHDNVVQAFATVSYAQALGEDEVGGRALEQAMQSAQELVSQLLAESPIDERLLCGSNPPSTREARDDLPADHRGRRRGPARAPRDRARG
jgi:GAF domain-containing protein